SLPCFNEGVSTIDLPVSNESVPWLARARRISVGDAEIREWGRMEFRWKLITDYHILSQPAEFVTAGKSKSQLDLREKLRPWHGRDNHKEPRPSFYRWA